MTTTELIELLIQNEKGGISHKSREISLTINGKYNMSNPQITLSSTGDGVCGAEIDLDIDGDFMEEQEPKTEWTPVSERLPEKNGRYLVTRGLNAIGALWNRVYIVNFSDLMGIKSTKIFWIGNVGKSDFESLEDVIAWMPLPEPYEESEG